MKLTYEVTEEIYAEAIAYQMKLNNSSVRQMIRYWVLNIAFAAMAVYFFFARSDYSLVLRLGPAAMAAVLIALSTRKRINLPARARSALKRYIRQGVLEEGFLGEHILVVENGRIRRRAGRNWKEVKAGSFAALVDLDQAVLMIAGGVIFDTIPRKTLDRETRGQLLDAIEAERAAARRKIYECSDRTDFRHPDPEDGEGTSDL